MGLGSRTARQHTTAASERTAAVGDSSWAFEPGQAVMTVDGFSGKITAVNDGFAGESYDVVLDGGLGGGEYTASQLSPKHEATQYTAAADYPELAEILVQRPDIAPNTRWASLRATASGDEHWGDDFQQCPECGGPVNTAHTSMEDHLSGEHGVHPGNYSRGDQFSAWEKHAANDGPRSFRDAPSEHDHSMPKGPYGIESHEELEPNDGAAPDVDEHGHLTWDGSSPACRDTNEYSMFGQNDAVKQAAFYTADELRALGEAEMERMAAAGDTSAQDWIKHRENLEQKRTQDDAVRASGPCQSCGGSDHTTGEHMGWAEQKHAEGTHDAWGRPLMQPYDGHGAWSCNNYNCSEHPSSMYDDGDGQRLQTTPGWLTHDAGPDAQMRREVNQAMSPKDTEDANWLLQQQHEGPTHLSRLQRVVAVTGPMDSGGTCIQCAAHGMLSSQETVGKCDACGQDKDIYRYRSGGYESKPESLCLDCLDSGHHMESAHDQAEADVETINHLSRRPAGQGGFHPVWMKSAALDPWNIVTTAAADPDFRFEVTAAWSDVRAKAKRIRAEGGVHVTLATSGIIVGEIKGDTHTYETGIQRLPGRTAIHSWSCGCKWGAYHWGADDDFSRFAGRMCSHALALQYEAQSRGMFGRDVLRDDAKPSWTKRMVVVKHDIDSGRDITAPSTPVTASLARYARLQGETWTDIALAFNAAGIALTAEVLRTQAAANDAWGEPSPHQVTYAPGPTKPKDPTENPASAGWASAPEPDDWGQAGPSGLTHMVSSLQDDDAIFEPEMGKEAFLPLLIPLAEGLAGAGAGAAAAGAAEVGAGAAAAGAGEAAGAGLLRTVVPKVIEKGVQHKVLDSLLPGEDDKQADGPQGPTQPEQSKPLSWGAPAGPSRAEHNSLTATLDEEPEGALPFTDGADMHDPDSLEPDATGIASTGSVSDIVAQFQATAGAHLAENAKPQGNGDIAAAARAFLETGQMPMQATALKDFTLAEQQKIINEGENVRAANLDRLDITGTHYEPLEAALAAADTDEEWMS